MVRFVLFRQHLYHQADQHFPFAASESTMISLQETRPPVLRDPRPADEADWRRLWSGYCKFYETEVPEAVTAATWERMLRHLGAARRFMDDPAHLLSGGPLRRHRLARTWHRPRADRGPASTLPRARLVATLLAYARVKPRRAAALRSICDRRRFRPLPHAPRLALTRGRRQDGIDVRFVPFTG